MAKRKEDFHIGEYYHIFNRGIEKRKIFMEEGDLYYFFDAMFIAMQKEPINDRHSEKRKDIKETAKNKERLVEIVSYSLLPNHYHLILKEIRKGGISRFMGKLSNSYTKYFNQKNDRIGVLFQGPFKANRLTGEDKKEMSLELTSAYVNLNYKHHNYNIEKDLIKSSVFEYLNEEKGERICNVDEVERIIENIGGVKKYKEWLKGQSKFFTERHNNDPDLINFDELEK